MKKKNFHKQVKGVLDKMELPDNLKIQMDKTDCKIHIDLAEGFSFIELTDKHNLQSKRAYLSNEQLLKVITNACVDITRQNQIKQLSHAKV